VEVAVNDMVTVGLLHVRERGDAEAGTRRLRKAKMYFLEVCLGRLDGDLLEALDLFLLGFRARGERGLGAEAIDEPLEVGDFALLVFVAGGLLRVTLVLLAEVIVDRFGAK